MSSSYAAVLSNFAMLVPAAQISHDSLHCEREGIILRAAFKPLVPCNQIIVGIEAELEDVLNAGNVSKTCQGFLPVKFLLQQV